MHEDFEAIGRIEQIEPIAVGTNTREIKRLRKAYGHGRGRKLKGIATVRLEDGTICRVELHWYEAHGIGRKKLKIKEYLDETGEDYVYPRKYFVQLDLAPEIIAALPVEAPSSSR